MINISTYSPYHFKEDFYERDVEYQASQNYMVKHCLKKKKGHNLPTNG